MNAPTDPHAKPNRAARAWPLADRLAAAASLLCAVHCAVLPFAIALLPVMGMAFLAGHAFERGFVVFAASLAAIALVAGQRRHARWLPLLLATPGLALLVLGVTIAEAERGIALHAVMVTGGGLLVAAAHLANLRLGPTCRGG